MVGPSWILPSWICHLGFGHLSVSSQTHSHLQRLVPPFCIKKTSLILSDSIWWWQPCRLLTKLDWDTAILDSETLLSSLRFTQKHSHTTLTLIQTNSIWLKLIHSHFTWWLWPSWILAILDSVMIVFPLKLTHTCQDLVPIIWSKKIIHSLKLILMMAANLNSAKIGFIHLLPRKKTSIFHSHSTWWWQPSWILPYWLQPFCTKKFHSFILTQLDDGSHLEFHSLEFGHGGFSHFALNWLKII